MKFRLLLLLVLISTTSFAQIQNEKGRLTFKDGTILDGTITYYFDTSKEIVFYNDQGSKEIFRPSEVRGIALNNGERFVTRGYKLNQDSVTLVLQSLIESPKISLLFREDNSSPYYYVLKDNILHRLENNDVISTQDRRTYKRKDNKYIGTLSMLMSDRIDLIESLDKVALKESDLTRLILDYNQGDVTYNWKSESEIVKESNWVAFAQHSQHATLLDDATTGPSSGQMVGLQYYFSKHSRHSVKASLERSYYDLENDKIEFIGLGFRYQYTFIQSEKSGIYMLVHLVDIGYAERTRERRTTWTEKGIAMVPRFSPGLGFEFKPMSKMAVYAEINHLIRVKHLPQSFSLGIKYDFGKNSW